MKKQPSRYRITYMVNYQNKLETQITYNDFYEYWGF